MLVPDELRAIGYWWDEEMHCFVDEDGFAVYDIYNFVPVDAVNLFLRTKSYLFWMINPYAGIELFWPEKDY